MKRAVWESWRDEVLVAHAELTPFGATAPRLRRDLEEAFRRGVLAAYDTAPSFDVETVCDEVGIR